MQRCPNWGNKGKCKKGKRCTMAHGDHELIPKELKQQINRNNRAAEAAAKERQAALEDAMPVRQREGPDELSSDEESSSGEEGRMCPIGRHEPRRYGFGI